MIDLATTDIYRICELASAEHLSLFERIEESFRSYDYLVEQGYRHWIITFSGGKDSTLTLVLALEYALKHQENIDRIDILFSDTLVEIPSIHKYALDFLGFLNESERLLELPIFTHRLFPRLSERYWVKVLGKGYPPPHQKFRWCTRRLKIEPGQIGLKEHMIPGQTAILTGVRFGESNARDQRLNASCSRGGECGQGLWFDKSNAMGIGYMAPIINWQTCDIWDFLIGFAPEYGYPTKELKEIYNGHDTRFGCWTCTVVKQDKAMARTISRNEWAHLQPLYDFRNHLWDSTRPRRTREIKPNGYVGKLKLSVRKRLLKELLAIQDQVGMQLISDEEIQEIKKMWKSN